jgi:hypothetical protein
MWARALFGTLLFATACGGGDGGGTTNPTGAANLAGSWIWQSKSNGPNKALGATCVASGQLTLSQSGNQVSGVLANASASCLAGGDSYEFDPGGDFNNGVVSGNTFIYDDGVCRFTGTASGSPPNKVEGPASCDLDYLGATVPLTGAWEMHR